MDRANAKAEMRKFSVVVCTRNRANFLEDTVESVLAQNYPKELYELIVVDNDSRDGTRALVDRYVASDRIPVSYHLERRPGASFARNLGIERACYDYVAFLDDDTTAAPGWLAAYDVAIRENDVVAAGGPVEPAVEPGVELPSWWNDIKSLFSLDHAHLYPGQRVVTIRWPIWLGACNSVYSKRLLRDYGGFRIDCGPVGRRYRVAQDVDLNVRLERAGVPIHYVSDAWIKHRVTADRLTRRYVWQRTYCAGITDAHAWAMLGRRSNVGSLRQLARATLQLLMSGEAERTAAGCQVAYRLGYLRKSWALTFEQR
jgi:glycosyltransferase involved in cell wall biosynthesis